LKVFVQQLAIQIGLHFLDSNQNNTRFNKKKINLKLHMIRKTPNVFFFKNHKEFAFKWQCT
jgi:hypothetical protein